MAVKSPRPGSAQTELRPVRPEDRAFLQAVYASTREDELKTLDWNEQRKNDFVGQQFEAQHAYYAEHFPNAAFDVILKAGEPIGRLYVDRRADEIRLIDIAVLPGFQRGGIGTSLLESLLDEAQRGSIPLRIHVEKFNPAMRLYQRLGFQPIEDQGVYFLMEWRA